MTTKFLQQSLSDCLETIIDYRGKTPKKLGIEWCDSGYRAISANNVKFDGLTKVDSINCINKEGYKKWMKEEVRKGDLLLTSEAPAGQVMLWMSEEKIVLSQRLFALRTKPNVYNKYLKYYLQSNVGQFEINKNTTGSTVFGISAKMFDFIKVNLPDFDSQLKVGDLLYLIDCKIELNKRINTELEVVAKTIYDYWFVQFDYPNVNGIPYKSNGGKMVWNEELKREIPEGWEVGKLGEIADLIRGVTYSSSDIKNEFDEDIIPILRATNISANVIDLNSLVYVPKEHVSEDQLLNKYDILITMSSGSIDHIGKNGFYYFDKEVAFGAFCAKIKAKKNYKFYLYSYTQSDFLRNTIKNECLGTNINNLNGGLVNAFKLVKPHKEVIDLFNEKVSTIYKKIENNTIENQQLTSLRDWLLPLLMNGQVEVYDN